MNFYYHNTIGLNILRFFKELLNKTILVLIAVVFIAYFLNLIPGSGWVNFIIKGTTYTIIYVTLIYFFGMINFEKELFKTMIKKKIKN